MTIEIWKPIPNYEGFYEASTLGNIRSVCRTIILKGRNGEPRPSLFKGKMLKQAVEVKNRFNWKPRKYVVLSKNGVTKRFYVHRLIAITFIPNTKNKPDINHKDGDPFNNVVENLEWVTSLENLQHAFKNHLIHTQKQVAQYDNATQELITTYVSEAEACRAVGVSQGKIGRAIRRNGTCKGYKWKYI